MVRLIGIIQVYFLFEQSQWVSNEEVSNMLGQEMINACQDRLHRSPIKAVGPTVYKSSQKTGQFSKSQYRALRSLGSGWFVRAVYVTHSFIVRTLSMCQSFICYLHNAWLGHWCGPRQTSKVSSFAQGQKDLSIRNLKLYEQAAK